MSEVKVGICTVGIGGWYPRGVARMIQQFHEVSHGFTIQAWVNVTPPGAVRKCLKEGVDYAPYMAKPFALKNLMHSGFDIGILLDAAFYPIRHIQPLVDHILTNSYYLCRNGAQVGEWSSDEALREFGSTRDAAMEIPEVSSYCVGFDFSDDRCTTAVYDWCESAFTFPGPHTNLPLIGRNPGHCSADPRCKGHRHDQTALSIIAHDAGMDQLVSRPRFTAYLGSEDETTVLINHGGL